tara:strand:- start:26 stop:187 length:162 start_codon:yes stop_codon:yes gene_type:complete
MGPAGFEPATSSTPGWHHSQSRRRPLVLGIKLKLLNRRLNHELKKLVSFNALE